MDFEYTTTGDNEYDNQNNNNEIISIAGVVIDEKNNVVDEFHELVKPTKNTVIHPFCTELTKITQEDVDNADTFNLVADKFMLFLDKYRKEELYIYTWGHFDSLVIKKTFDITGYDGNFTYVYKNITDIQKRICCSITYNKKTIKSVWSLKDAKRAFNLKESKNSHNALVDARDLKDIYVAYKNKKPKNFRFILQVYQKQLCKNIINSQQKEYSFDCVPGELKYGLEKLFKYSLYTGINTRSITFNKKTMQFINHEIDLSDKDAKFYTELKRYSKTKLDIEIINKRDYFFDDDIDENDYSLLLTFKTKSEKLNFNVEPTFEIPIIPKNSRIINTFIEKVRECENLIKKKQNI